MAGFQGVSQDTKDITTLGRGASDTTAVALAAALGAEVCEIYSDVDGVFTADPRIVPTARKLDRISTEEMLEMAASGAKILHLRCVEYARRYNMPVHVRSSFSQKEGTWIIPDTEGEEMEQAIIAGVAHDRSEAKITVVGVPDKVGEAARIFEALAAAEVNIDMVVQNVSAAATGLHRHLVHAAPRRRPVGDGRAGPDPGRGRLRQAALRRPDRQGLADRRRHALAPRHHREVLRRARLRGRQHRDDLHLGDPDLGDRRRGARSTPPCRPPTPRSTSTPTRSRPWSTAGPDDEMGVHLGVVGATGQVGVAMRQILAERDFPVDEIRFFASARSAGTVLPFAGREIVVEDASTADPSRARHRAVLRRRDHLARAGPEVRRGRRDRRRQLLGLPDGPRRPAGRLRGQPATRSPTARKGIIANPNCTTMAAMPVLKPLHDEAGLVRLIASTYQAVSGSGVAGVEELADPGRRRR